MISNAPVRFSDKILYGEPRLTGSGRVTSPAPKPDKKGKLRKYAIEMWLLQEARIEAAGNAGLSVILSDFHAHCLSEAQSRTVHLVLEHGAFPDWLKKLSFKLAGVEE